MTLGELFGAAAGERRRPGGHARSPTTTARWRPGRVFFCVARLHARRPRLRARGGRARAAALVVERPLGLGVPEVLVRRRARCDGARARRASTATRRRACRSSASPGRTARRRRRFLDARAARGRRDATGLLGTVEQVVGGVDAPAVRTTPEAIDLQATFAAMLDAGDGACVMEVSSHALELRRADAIHWRAAVFTNLTQDHLDFHPTMDDYFPAKRRLFDGRARALRVVNIDDPYGRRLAEDRGRLTVGIDARDADLRATDLRADFGGTSVQRRRPASCASPLPGPLQRRSTRSARSPWRASSASPTTTIAARAAARGDACPGASSRSTRARTSRCSSTTRTRPTRWRTCCAPRAG